MKSSSRYVNLLLYPSHFLWPPNFHSAGWAPTARPKDEDSPSVQRCHLLQLSFQLFVILPKLQSPGTKDVLWQGWQVLHAFLRLELDIKFDSFLQPFAVRVPAFPCLVAGPLPSGEHGDNDDQTSNIRNRCIVDEFSNENQSRYEEIWRFLADELKVRDGEDAEGSEGKKQDQDVDGGEGR